MKLSELVALSLIVVICVGLVASWVGRVRDVAANQACVNNLKQLGIAVENYHGVDGRYPAATEPNSSLPPERRISWHLTVLPYVEANNIYTQVNLKEAWDTPENLRVAPVQIRVYQCPSWPQGRVMVPLCPTTYPGLTGVGKDAASFARDDKHAGLFGYEPRLSRQGIAGRTSTVMLAAETSETNQAWTAGGFPTARGLDPEGPPYLGFGGQFGGLHRGGGANVLFADGSVRFLERSTDPKVFEAMAVIRGSGEAAP